MHAVLIEVIVRRGSLPTAVRASITVSLYISGPSLRCCPASFDGGTGPFYWSWAAYLFCHFVRAAFDQISLLFYIRFRFRFIEQKLHEHQCYFFFFSLWVLLWQHDSMLIFTDAAWECSEGIIAFMVCLLRQTMTRLFLDAAHKPYFLWYYWPFSVLIISVILQNPHFIQALWIFSLVQKTQSELICWYSHITINNFALGSSIFFLLLFFRGWKS